MKSEVVGIDIYLWRSFVVQAWIVRCGLRNSRLERDGGGRKIEVYER